LKLVSFLLLLVPIPSKKFDLVPIYFKKAISEVGSEWSNNKKLIDTKGKLLLKFKGKGY
jgi:hypothetical protein